MKQRKGFTLIELMIVIAIIIILAAIAIPNYLRMTDRARRSRVAGDFTSVATALEAYSVDWGHYPIVAAAQNFGHLATNTMIYYELTGNTNATTNKTGNTTLTGEDGGIEYIKAGTLAAMYDPFAPSTDDYTYNSNPAGSHWILYCKYSATDSLYRTDMVTNLTQVATGSLPAVPTP
jgi:prepilin-type N-terminal cleavage/methylation domain-containing protein